MKKLITRLILALLIAWVPTTLVFGKTLKCTTPRMQKTFTVNKSTVTFYYEEDSIQAEQKAGRAIASAVPMRTKRTGSGFTKYFTYEGNRYTIHIDNINHLSEVDDYMTIRSSEGHEILYPITCS
ncbi:MAG: hypothetical protein ISR65_00725 [Bacteriovoracaceae bacterium]|nr:hypothetical protein [Bacteriovoracaceae bacterium]